MIDYYVLLFSPKASSWCYIPNDKAAHKMFGIFGNKSSMILYIEYTNLPEADFRISDHVGSICQHPNI